MKVANSSVNDSARRQPRPWNDISVSSLPFLRLNSHSVLVLLWRIGAFFCQTVPWSGDEIPSDALAPYQDPTIRDAPRWRARVSRTLALLRCAAPAG